MKRLFHSLTKSLGLTANGHNGHKNEFQKLGRVVPDPSRCVQCGVCGYNCPVGIPVRDYAHRGLAVDDPSCITCGNCIQVCPRGTLRWETNMQIRAFTQIRMRNALFSPPPNPLPKFLGRGSD